MKHSEYCRMRKEIAIYNKLPACFIRSWAGLEKAWLAAEVLWPNLPRKS